MSIKSKKTTVRNNRTSAEVQTLEQIVNTLPTKVVRYGIGFDMHKHTIAVCVKAQLEDSTIVLIQQHIFSAHPAGITEILRFLDKFTPVSYYLMECTGVYHLPLFRALKQHFSTVEKAVVAMNPLMMNRRLTEFGNKNDKVDASRIADLSFYDQLVKPSYIGSQSFFQLRHLLRTYMKNRIQMGRMKNRIYRNLDACNQKFPWELNTTWCLDLLNWYIGRDWTFLVAYNAFIQHQREAKKPIKVLIKAQPDVAKFGEIALCPETRFSIQMDLYRLADEETFSATIIKQAETWVLANPDLKENYQKLMMVPGCGAVTAMIILLELGDFRRFSNWKAFCKYCGVIPNIAQSGDQLIARHLNRNTNSFIREVLTQSGTSLLNQNKTDSDLSLYANRVYRLKKMPYKKAMIKVAYKLARTIYCILVLGINYDPKHNSDEKKGGSSPHLYVRRGSYLESNRIRGLRRDVQDFFVNNSEFLNSDIRHHLTQGFSHVIKKAVKEEPKKEDPH